MPQVSTCYRDFVQFFLQKKKAISRRKEVTDDLATYCYQMRVSLPTMSTHCSYTTTHTPFHLVAEHTSARQLIQVQFSAIRMCLSRLGMSLVTLKLPCHA